MTDIFIDISIDIFIDISIDVLIDMLTDKEEGGGRKEGVDFFLKSNNPTPTGGEHKPSKTAYEADQYRPLEGHSRLFPNTMSCSLKMLKNHIHDCLADKKRDGKL